MMLLRQSDRIIVARCDASMRATRLIESSDTKQVNLTVCSETIEIGKNRIGET